MDRAELGRLLTPEALRLLDELPGYPAATELSGVISSLRGAGHAPELVAAVLTQARLRQKAAAKFGEFASRMLFTDAGLEQATRLRVAAMHAGRYQAAAISSVVDLGSGIGADSLAIAALGLSVTAVEVDEVTAAIAAYNLAPFDTATVVHGDAVSTDLSRFDAAFIDPARRRPGHQSSSGRVTPDAYSPGLDYVFEVARRMPTGIKLGPAFPRTRIPAGVEAQWVSVGGDVVEMALWSGALARDGITRSALRLDGGGVHELHSDGDSPDERVGDLGAYLHEPDGSVIRARLVGNIARAEGATTISPGIAYLTSDHPSDSPFLASFRIRERLEFDPAVLKRELRKRGIGALEIKKRGVDIDPASFRKKLALQGTESATLVVTRVAGRHVALLADRV